MSDFAQIYPNVFVDITSGNMETSMELIARGEVDMAVGFGPVGQPALKRYSYNRGAICAIVRKDHAISGLTKVTLQELSQHRLIAMHENFGLQRYLTAMFRDEAIMFRPSYCCNLFTSAIALCSAGLGIAFMTEQTANANSYLGNWWQYRLIIILPESVSGMYCAALIIVLHRRRITYGSYCVII